MTDQQQQAGAVEVVPPLPAAEIYIEEELPDAVILLAGGLEELAAVLTATTRITRAAAPLAAHMPTLTEELALVVSLLTAATRLARTEAASADALYVQLYHRSLACPRRRWSKRLRR